MHKKDYDDEERIILINEVDETPISSAIHSLFSFAQQNKSPIYIIVNTFGGQIYDMFALYDAIKYVQSLGISVNTVGLGKIMSAGVIILAAGDSRKIGRNATIMWHLASSTAHGDIFEMKNELSEVERLEDLCNDILSRETSMTKKEVEDLISSRMDVFITPEKAIAMGFVDSYLESPIKKVKPVAKKKSKKRV